MVDVTVTTGPDTSFATAFGQHGIIWDDSHTVGYYFYPDDTAAPNKEIRYVKTLDGGDTWQAPVQMNVATDVTIAFSVWADWHTPGDFGSLIHFTFYSGNANRIKYGNLNVNNDALGTERDVSVSLADSPTRLGITKSRGGELSIVWNSPSAVARSDFLISEDDGVTWDNKLDPWNSSLNDDHEVYLFPSDESDANDIWAIVQDTTADEFQFFVYTRASNTWASAIIVGSWLTVSGNMGTALSHSTRHLWLIGISGNPFGVSAPIRVWEIGGLADIVEKTNVLTSDDYISCDIMIDRATNDVYVCYGRGADVNSLVARSKVSRDLGITWEDEVTEGDGTTYVIRRMDVPPIVVNRGRWLVTWYDETLDDILTNTANAINIGQAENIPITPPRVVQAKSTASEVTTYISPDGIEYPFHTPHNLGRWIISESGWGTPPINYVTQRGPFQNGVTVKDFFLQPRVIQLLIRQGFCDRDALWVGRAGLLDEIRPNRQTIATAVVPGELRRAFADGRVRSLEVFIAEGPRFEPTQVNVWDEFAFQEVLRFIAHNPVVFDPTRNDVNFTIVLDSDLVFPITFPIQFGSGEVDDTLNINYVGTWESLPIIVITGPIEQPRIDNVTTGEKLQFSIDISPGQIVTIDLSYGSKTVIDNTGANLIGGLTADSDLATFHIAPTPEAPLGVNAMRLRGQHATGATSVQIRYFDRFFGI